MRLKYTNSFAKEFRDKKQKKGLTFREIEEKTGIGIPNLCDISKGKINPSLSRAILLAKTLDIKLDQLKP